MSVGLYVVRWRRKRLGLPPPVYRAWNIAVIFTILVNVFLLVMPWYPPAGGPYAGDVSFWYATYVVVGIGIVVGCGVYYAFWIYVLPRLRGYNIRQELLTLENSEQTHRLVQILDADIEQWDASHDAVGREIRLIDTEDRSG